MRVEAMSIRVRPRLQAIAAGPPSPASTVRVMRVPGASGRWEFRMRTGMPRPTAGRIVARVQDLGAEVGELGGLVEAQLRDDAGRRHHPRVGGEHAVDVGPDLDLVGGEPGPEERGREVGAAAPEGGGEPGRGGADEAADHRHEPVGQQRAHERPQPLVGRLAVGEGGAVLGVGHEHAPARRASGRRGPRPRAPRRRCGCWPARRTPRSRPSSAARPPRRPPGRGRCPRAPRRARRSRPGGWRGARWRARAPPSPRGAGGEPSPPGAPPPRPPPRPGGPPPGGRR